MTNESKNKTMFNRFALKGLGGLIGLVAIVILAFSFGALFFGGSEPVNESDNHSHAKQAAESTVWTCSMHPQIKLPKKGKCPLCFMDLIPLDIGSGDDLGPRQLRMSESAKSLARIQTTVAQLAFAEKEIRMVGKIRYDETRLSYITAWVPGRLDRLYADFTGMTVSKGDHLVSMYSPELLAAQEELIQAISAIEALSQSSSDVLKSTAVATADASREKLRLFGLSADQIIEIESNENPSDHLTINAPIGGVVVHKNAQEGMYVKTGTQIYTIADLSKLWVIFEAYESDLPWLRYGQQVSFSSPSFSGQSFDAIISFIDPIVNSKTRTVQVRAIVDNKNQKLKPDMFVRGVVKSKIDGAGLVIDTYLAGKWISPMHPEVVKDRPGQCDVCGMDLVRAESLGYASKKVTESDAPLLIPASAPLITGKRAVVYVELPNDEGPLFEGREVQLGPRAGDFYVVISGIEEGELIVTNGAFKLDSELQIQAKPSMMSPKGGAATIGHQHGETNSKQQSHDRNESSTTIDTKNSNAMNALSKVYKSYFDLQMALANDDQVSATKAAGQLEKEADAVDMTQFSRIEHSKWMELAAEIMKYSKGAKSTTDIESTRQSFYYLSNSMIELHEAFGHADSDDYFLTFCPMARDNEGAYWLQTVDTVYNSFYGASMLRCGSIKKTLPAKKTNSSTKSSSVLIPLKPIYHAYFQLQRSLTFDNLQDILDDYNNINVVVGQSDLSMLAGDELDWSTKEINDLLQFTSDGVLAENVSSARTLFLPVAKSIINIHDKFGHLENKNYYLINCPHATSSGSASWIQDVDTMYNSFLGGVMASCTQEIESLPPHTGGGE